MEHKDEMVLGKPDSQYDGNKVGRLLTVDVVARKEEG